MSAQMFPRLAMTHGVHSSATHARGFSRPPRQPPADREDSLATTLVKNGIFGGLKARQVDLDGLRVGQALVDAQGKPVLDHHGRPIPAKTDISYLTPRGIRVNIELDTRPSAAAQHARHNNSDPRALNYYLLVDQASNKIVGGVARNPGGSVVQLGPKRLAQLARGDFPMPQPAPPQRKRPTTPREAGELKHQVQRDEARRQRAATRPAATRKQRAR